MERLRRWFLANRRPLPWRTDPTPYRVWVSEVMLQQTQAAVVIPYFEDWMARFPTLAALASASEEEVVKQWEGLGYYSRARNLHAGARLVVEQHAGEMPTTAENLAEIKGLGPYTVAAILSFAYGEKAAAVDGNVLRVVARYLGFEEDISKARNVRFVREKVEALLPDSRPHEVMEGLIELGAKVCRKQPACAQCPLRTTCRARAEARQAELPFNSRKTRVTDLHRLVAVVRAEGALLVKKTEPGQVMAGLYQFPYFEADGRDIASCVDELGLHADVIDALPEVKHTFTRFRAHLYPWLLESEPREVPGFTWVAESELDQLPFSSGHRRILIPLPSIIPTSETARPSSSATK
jgi:A/G-specific adenine glycosylase